MDENGGKGEECGRWRRNGRGRAIEYFEDEMHESKQIYCELFAGIRRALASCRQLPCPKKAKFSKTHTFRHRNIRQMNSAKRRVDRIGAAEVGRRTTEPIPRRGKRGSGPKRPRQSQVQEGKKGRTAIINALGLDDTSQRRVRTTRPRNDETTRGQPQQLSGDKEVE